jgi:hypothetical protein
MQTKIVETYRGYTIIGVVDVNGNVAPPFTVFKGGLKIAAGFSFIENAEGWIDAALISQPTPEEDENVDPPSPSPF